jgi:hypothetical protein
LCGKPCPILSQFKQFSFQKSEFSGSSPPEIFVGRNNYPNINTGILSPTEFGNTEEMSLPEKWHENNASIQDIINYRSRMIYSRFKSSVKRIGWDDKNFQVMQEVAMSSKSADMEFFLKKRPSIRMHANNEMPIIGNPAPLKSARFQENPKIEKKVDYLVNDVDVKSKTALNELYESGIKISNIIKILSAGLLGLKKQRKLVPTRWAITATDSNLSGQLLEKIRYYPQISEFMLFHSEYIGNHYEIILIPGEFSYELIEAKMSGSVWNPGSELCIMKDYETWHGRKDYAENCAGGYYVVRLALAEYLNRIRRQAAVFVMRECRPEYWAPCGVGILRETVRDAFQKQPEKFSNLNETLQTSQKRLRLPVAEFTKESFLLKIKKEQKKLLNYLK